MSAADLPSLLTLPLFPDISEAFSSFAQANARRTLPSIKATSRRLKHRQSLKDRNSIQKNTTSSRRVYTMGNLSKAIADAFADMDDPPSRPPRVAAAARNRAAKIKHENGLQSDGSSKHRKSHATLKLEPMDSNSDSERKLPNTVVAITTSDNHNNNYSNNSIDMRLPYRHGWPLLPSLPVSTSTLHIPKALSKTSLHMAAFTSLLHTHKVPVHTLSTTHRHHTGTALGKQTLTLLVASHVAGAATWEPAIHTLRKYIIEHGLTLRVEVIDHRVVKGVVTLPVMPYDAIASFMARKKHGVVALLEACGMPWTSLEFFYRGLEGKRQECRATVLIGVPRPEEWGWVEVGERVREKVGGRLAVEVVWREVRKF